MGSKSSCNCPAHQTEPQRSLKCCSNAIGPDPLKYHAHAADSTPLASVVVPLNLTKLRTQAKRPSRRSPKPESAVILPTVTSSDGDSLREKQTIRPSLNATNIFPWRSGTYNGVLHVEVPDTFLSSPRHAPLQPSALSGVICPLIVKGNAPNAISGCRPT